HLFPAVASHVSDTAQNLVHARQKLRYFRDTLGQGLGLSQGSKEKATSLPCNTDLLPFGSGNLAEAAKKLFRHIEPQLSLHIDETFQDQVLNQHGGLWGFLTGKQDMTGWVKRELQHRALTALLDATRDLDAAKLFLESRKDPEEGKLELLNHVAAVAPNLDVSSHWQHRVIALPDSQAGALVRGMLSQALTDVPSTVLHSEGDMVFCHEAANLPIRQMAELLLGDETTYMDAAAQVMTRVDVAWSPLACSPQK